MSKNNENKLVPRLRFPEFVNEREWNEKPFERFCLSISSGKDKNIIDGVYELYGSTGIIGRAENASYNGDFILVARVGANAGLLNKVQGKFGVTDNTLVVDLIKKDLIDFIFYSLDKVGLNKLVFGSGQPLITGGQLKSLLLSTPHSEQEQQKIAACLSSLDEVITAESQKLELYQQHKKGLLQNLFPNSLNCDSQGLNDEHDFSKVPKLRFPDFEMSEWEVKELGSLCINVFSGKDKNIDGGEYKLYGSTGIIGKTENASYEGNFILVARVGANAGLLNKVTGKFGVTDNTLVIDLLNKDSVNFIFYSLESFGLNKLVFGSGQPLITGRQLKGFLLSIPCSESEQQKIALCLSSLDDLINAQRQKIELLKQHKKGLLQGLFPPINN